MFGLGPTEMIVIAIVAILVLGPQRIPTAATQLGKAIRNFRRATMDFRNQIDEEGHIGRTVSDLRSALQGNLPPEPVAQPASTSALIKPALQAPIAQEEVNSVENRTEPA